MAHYGLAHIYQVHNGRNARNCAEMVHGIPFLRLARFGFFAEPSPQDLGSILNCNALYTFTTGIPQIAFGVMIVFGPNGATLNALLPLFVSGASLALSLVNIFLNFAQILSELNDEQNMTEKIKNSQQTDFADRQKRLESEYKATTNRNKKEYDEKLSEAQGAYAAKRGECKGRSTGGEAGEKKQIEANQ